MSKTPTEVLAGYVTTGIDAAGIPEATASHAGTAVLDAIGNGLFGAGQEAVRLIDAEVRGRYAPGPAMSWPSGGKLHPAGAANINAAAAHGFEFDDYLPAGKTHVGAVVVPVALAVADPDLDGAGLLEAVIAGYETMGRISIAANGSSVRARGWHITGLIGPFGAAAVAGRLDGLSPAQMASAFGVAASTAAGTFSFSGEGAMTKCFHAGRAAEAGVVATALARSGFKGPLLALDAEDGGLLRAIGDAPRFEELEAELGTRFDLDSIAIKPYPCCGSAHSSIDAVISLREQFAIRPEDVLEISVANAKSVLLQCGFPYSGRGERVEAQMSLQFCLAAALTDGDVNAQHFLGGRPAETGLVDLARRVVFEHDPAMDEIYPKHFPSRVTITTRDGKTHETSVTDPKGSRANPMERDDAEGKFRKLVEGLGEPAIAEELIEMTRNLAELGSVKELTTAVDRLAVSGLASA